jgi:hypothetical protein
MTAQNVRMAKGPTILLGSGTYHDFDEPEKTQLTIEDYAYSLAFECRFRGQCVSRKTGKRMFYSVAQHAVICSEAIISAMVCSKEHAEDLAFEALMHESGEVVMGDMTSPLKQKIPSFKAEEDIQERAIGRRFGVTGRYPKLVKDVDMRMWATERRDLMAWDGKPWGGDSFGDGVKPIEPYPFEVVPVGPYEAATMFINRWLELGGPRRFVEACGETPVLGTQHLDTPWHDPAAFKAGYALAAERLMLFAEHDGEVKGKIPKRKKKHEYAAAFSSLLKRWRL